MDEVLPRTNVCFLAYGHRAMAKTANTQPRRGPLARFPRLAAIVVVVAAWAAWSAAPAGAETVYRATPPGPVAAAPSLGFEPGEITELGSLVKLAGSSRTNPTVGLGVSVWACEQGSWDGGCLTAPGATFTVPLTLTVYAAEAGGAPGPVVARVTRDTTLAYRPTSGCVDGSGKANGFEVEGVCADGLPQTVAFPLAGVTLPSEAIVTVAFDPTTGPARDLRIQLATPSVGTSAAAPYAAVAGGPLSPDSGLGTGPGQQPALALDAETPAPPAAVTTPPTAAVPAPPAIRLPRGPSLALKRKMKVSFPTRTARLGGPGALVQAKCTGSSAARCMGTLSLSIGGATHKVPFSITKNRKQYLVIPLGDELERISTLRSPRAVVTARTVQISGAALKTTRILKLK